jgi:hypothetical protein
MTPIQRRQRAVLIAGDLLAYAVITLIGFMSHDEFTGRAIPRMLATYIPFLASWLLVAPWLGLYGLAAGQGSTVLWRVPLAAFLAGPLGAWLRGLALGAPILPVFVMVMVGVSGVVLTLWRTCAWAFYLRRTSR